MRKEIKFRKKLKRLEGKLNCNETKDECNVCKENHNVIYNEIANETANELGEKSNKFFGNLEKYRASHNTIKKVIHDAQEINGHQKINNHSFSFHKKLYEDCKMLVKSS